MLGLCLLLLTFLVNFSQASDEVAVPDDPSDPCSVYALNAYRACVFNNPCTCQNCYADPGDPDFVIEADQPSSCQDLSRIFCPHVRCCSACESEFAFYHSCLANKIANMFLGEDHNCQLFFCVNDNNDYTGECAIDDPNDPNSGGIVPVTNLCQAPLNNYQACIVNDSTCMGCPFSEVTQIDLDGGTQSCQDIHEDVLCPLKKCCPACDTQLEEVVTCVEDNIVSQPDDICPTELCPVKVTEAPTEAPEPIDTTDTTPATSPDTSVAAANAAFTSLCLVLIAGSVALLS